MSNQTKDRADEVAQVLRRSRRPKLLKWVFLALLLGGGFYLYQGWSQEAPPQAWKTLEVDRGDVMTSITTTGSLEPKREVQIGAEVSGEIIAVEVEENQEVVADQVLIRFDTEVLESSLRIAEASLSSAKAQVKRARATRDLARATEDRVETLVKAKSSPTRELESAQASAKQASADLEMAKAKVTQAEAEFARAKTNLSKAVIRSPIDGVVLLRDVEPGNTVAASLQAPELLVLAEDLREMVLSLEVDEADVSLLRAGQRASFTVDAWPEARFDAEVQTIRLYPTSTNNVITYRVQLRVDNSQRLLRPGMTATATITTDTHHDVLRVPSSALNFTPPTNKEKEGVSISFGPPRRSSSDKSDLGDRVWVLRDGDPVKVPLTLGKSDGRYTEVISGDLKAGDWVIVGVEAPAGRDKGEGKPAGGPGGPP